MSKKEMTDMKLYKKVLDKVYKLGDEDTKVLIDAVWAAYTE